MKYILSLSPNYVLEWGFWEAIRELLQNSIDQCKLDSHCKPIFSWEDNTLSVGTTNCILEPKSLLMGASSKREDNKMIGQFGEGYKLALLVLTRLQYEVRILNNGHEWSPSFKYSEAYEDHVLTVQIDDSPDNFNGVLFTIKDVSKEQWESLQEKYLMDEPNDKIFFEEYMVGRVFVGGLYICDVNGLKCGYNFAPGRLQLDRDRGLASTFQVTYHASKLWETCGYDSKLYDCLKAGAIDTQYVDMTTLNTNLYMAKRHMRETRGAIPVSSQDELSQHKGRKTQLVSHALNAIIRKVHSFSLPRSETPHMILSRFRATHKAKLTALAHEFDILVKTSKGW